MSVPISYRLRVVNKVRHLLNAKFKSALTGCSLFWRLRRMYLISLRRCTNYFHRSNAIGLMFLHFSLATALFSRVTDFD